MVGPVGLREQKGKVSVKNENNIPSLLQLIEKWLNYKIRNFLMVFNFLFYLFSLTFSVPEKLKNSIFEMPIITQILKINNLKTTSAKYINMHTIRKLVEHSLKMLLGKSIVWSPNFRKLLSKGRVVLSPVQLGTGSEMVKVLVENQKNIRNLVKLPETSFN